MVSKIMASLELLSDGKWHVTEELQLELGVNEKKIREITAFLSKYGFIKVDGNNRKLKINTDFQKLFVQKIS